MRTVPDNESNVVGYPYPTCEGAVRFTITALRRTQGVDESTINKAFNSQEVILCK